MTERFTSVEQEFSKEKSLKDKVVLLTGASRGIGAQIALKLGQEGAIVIGPHRDPGKEGRASEVAIEVEQFGGKLFPVVCDITNSESRANLVDGIKEKFGKVDIIIHNAAGGLETWATDEYALEINANAKVDLTSSLFEIISRDGQIIDEPSLWSYFVNTGIDKMDGYDRVARTKKDGEEQLDKLIPELNKRFNKRVTFGKVVGNAINGTPTVIGFRRNKEGMENANKLSPTGKIPDTIDMAQSVVDLLKSGFENGHVEFVGINNLSKKDIKERLSMYDDNALLLDRLVYIGENHVIGYSSNELPKDIDLKTRIIQSAAQTLGLIYVEQSNEKAPFPSFLDLEHVEFQTTEFGNIEGKSLEIEAKTTNIDDKGFQGDATIRIDGQVIAEIKGLDCGIMPARIAKRAIRMVRAKLATSN